MESNQTKTEEIIIKRQNQHNGCMPKKITEKIYYYDKPMKIENILKDFKKDFYIFELEDVFAVILMN